MTTAVFSGHSGKVAGNVYLEMKLDFFHLHAHKFGFYLKISNFLSGWNVKHDIFEPGAKKKVFNCLVTDTIYPKEK